MKNNKKIALGIMMAVLVIMIISSSSFALINGEAKIHKDLRKIIYEKPSDKIIVLVKIKNEKNLDAVSNLVSAKGDVKGKYKFGNIIAVELPAAQLEKIADYYEVESIWPNRIYHAVLQDSVPQINAPYMWSQGYNGSGIKIAILDTGVDATHPMLQGRVILENVFTGENHTTDYNGHGTHVAGIAAGSGSLKGVAPGALLMNAKVLDDSGSGTDLSVISGINWAVDPDGNSATNDATDIISMSLGAPYADLNSPIVSAIRDAVNAGAVVIVAAGNCGQGCPSSTCNGYIGIETPGVSPDAITVGAVDKNSVWACFSGGDIVNATVKPDVVAPGVSINSSLPSGYAIYSGTSMATPHVAGAAALLLQSNPSLAPADVKYIIERTSKPLGLPGKDVKYGYGLIDASKFIPPVISNVLKYRLSFPDIVYRNEPVNIYLNASLGNILQADAIITDPLGNSYNMSFTNITSSLWVLTFIQTSQLGIYELNVSVFDISGNETHFNEFFNVIESSMPDGFISQINIPYEIAHNATMPVEIIFQNSGNASLNVTVEMQFFDGSILFYAAESAAEIVGPASSHSFYMNWTALSTLGIKTLRAIASYGGTNHMLESQFSIIDEEPPLISQIYYSDISKNNPALIEIIVNDLNNVSGTLNMRTPSQSRQIQLEKISQAGSVSVLTATYVNTTEIGNYNFNFTVCDSASFCASSANYTFAVSNCSSPHLLVVVENIEADPDRYRNVLSADHCISIWDASKSLTPPLDYLQRFEAVIWSTGNYFGNNIDTNSSALLMNYIMNNGKLILEGPDIAFAHKDDEFMENIAHSVFEKDLNETSLSVIKTFPHPIFSSLADVLDFNISLSPYPDSILPASGGTEIAKWDSKNSSVVVFEGSSKILFVPFMLSALGEAQNVIISNIAGWLLTDENSADLKVKEIRHGYLIEGPNAFAIEIENAGLTDAANAKVDVFIEENLLSSFIINVSAGMSSNITFNASLLAGFHNVSIEINNDLAVIEKNYINNVNLTALRVATTEADLVPVSISNIIGENNVIIYANISNIGGTDANNVDVSLSVDGNSAGSQFIFLGYGSSANAVFTIPKESGVSQLLVSVNLLNNTIESDYSNNNLSSELYVCSISNVLIVDDNNGEGFSAEAPGSSGIFESALKSNSYCYTIWNETKNGVPLLAFLNSFDAVIWSAGDYWGNAIDANDSALLEQFAGRIIFEGSDIALEHVNDTLMQNHLHALLDRDLTLINETSLLLEIHPLFAGIDDITLNASLSPYPDSVLAFGGTSAAQWDGANASIIVFNETQSKMVYFAFSVDSIINETAKEHLIINAVEFVRNHAPVLQAIGNRSINENETLLIQLMAGDVDNDNLIFSINENLPGSFLFNETSGLFQWTPSFGEVGKYNITFNVTDGISSDSETITLTVNAVGDLIAEQVFVSSSIQVGQKVIMFFTVKNSATVNMFNISYSVNTGQQNITSQIPKINANTTAGVYAAWNYTQPALYSGKITVDYLSAFPERDENNNILNFAVNATMPQDTDVPLVNLISPPNNTVLNETASIVFNYNVTDISSGISFCDLIINSIIRQRDTTITENIVQTFTEFVDEGYYIWKVRCRDNSSNANYGYSENRTLNISLWNHRPVMDPIGSRIVEENQTLVIDVNASDQDNDMLTYYVKTNLPSSYAFNSSTGILTWTPRLNESGGYAASFNVTDGYLWDTETIIITVTDLLSFRTVSSCIDDPNQPGDWKLTQNISNSSGTCLSISSSNVTLDCQGYSIGGNKTIFSDGVQFSNDNIIIRNCIVKNFDSGINALCPTLGCFNISILNSTLKNSSYFGIEMSGPGNKIIISNNVFDRNGLGSVNTGGGMLLIGENMTISNNYLINGKVFGISTSASNVVITNNTITGNLPANNTYKWTAIRGTGIRNNTIFNNIISRFDVGINMSASAGNLIFNNFFNNTINAVAVAFNNWNRTKIAGTNIIGGPFLGGNFWNNYSGTDITPSPSGDGIGDTLLPYNSSSYIRTGGDFLPLVITGGAMKKTENIWL